MTAQKVQQKGSAKPKKGRCGRKLRGTKPPRYCLQFPLKGRDCCRLHGGKSLRGPASGTFKDGTYSAFMPQVGGRVFDQVLEHVDALDLRQEIAVLRTRLVLLLDGLEEDQQQEGSSNGATTGSSEKWEKAIDVAERISRTALRYHRIVSASEGSIPVEVLYATVEKLLSVVLEQYRAGSVPQPVLRAIASAFEAYAGPPMKTIPASRS